MAEESHDEHLSPLDIEIDPDFEPQKRPRSCTWPLPRPESNVGKPESTDADIIPEEEDDENGTDSCAANNANDSSNISNSGGDHDRTNAIPVIGVNAASSDKESDGFPISSQPLATAGSDTSANGLVSQQQPRKSSARRNAWGNYSYADLITQAIESTPEKRLTLAQIYDWMVRSVPYFKDKGDSNSSAGWKNSIRHNLSLHSRFVRVQNEGTGKSSWWMVNPEGGKGGKAPRRRAVSMDNSNKYTKSARGRAAKKKAAAALAAQDGAGPELAKWAGSPASRSSDELDAWTDFRSRTNSNASTASGRLSPILANLELDEAADGGAAPPSPMLCSSPGSLSPSAGLAELPRLADTMNLNDGLSDGLMDELLDDIGLVAAQQQQRSPDAGGDAEEAFGAPAGCYGAGPLFGAPSVGALRQAPMQTIQENRQATFSCLPHFGEPGLQDLLGAEPRGRSDVMLTQSDPLMSQASAAVSAQGTRRGSHCQAPGSWRVGLAGSAGAAPCLSGDADYRSSVKLRLQHSPGGGSNSSMQLGSSTTSSSSSSSSLLSSLNGCLTPLQLSSQDRFPPDLDLDVFNGSLECDMDAIIRNELMDADGLEFNFDSHLLSSQNANLNAGSFSSTKRTSSRSWVPG